MMSNGWLRAAQAFCGAARAQLAPRGLITSSLLPQSNSVSTPTPARPYAYKPPDGRQHISCPCCSITCPFILWFSYLLLFNLFNLFSPFIIPLLLISCNLFLYLFISLLMLFFSFLISCYLFFSFPFPIFTSLFFFISLFKLFFFSFFLISCYLLCSFLSLFLSSSFSLSLTSDLLQ